MKHSLLLSGRLALLACCLTAVPLQAIDFTTVKYDFDLPPSAELSYTIKARQKGFPIDGNAVMRWTATDGKFTAENEVRAILVGKILEAKSEGTIDDHGLAPITFTEKRFRKQPTTTSFDRETGTIRFSVSDLTFPIKGGEQDRNSIIWQLVAVARAAQGEFKPGSNWVFFVAGQRDAEPWTFTVVKQEKILTPLGKVNTLHVSRVQPSDAKGQQLDIWLAPQREWYPVRLRFYDDNGDSIEQTLEKISRKIFWF